VLFVDDLDRRRYLVFLAREVDRRGWSVLTYCQLTNHIHLLVRTPTTDLGDGFKKLHEDYARYLNGRHRLHGHVFGDRVYSGLVESDRHAVGCLRYIARNPIAAGICERARDWDWGAHRALAGLSDPPAFLDVQAAYAVVGADGAEPRSEYLRLVAGSDDRLLAELAHARPQTWPVAASDDFAIPIGAIASFLDVSPATAYRRVAAAREKEGTVP
jgi:putative transposase